MIAVRNRVQSSELEADLRRFRGNLDDATQAICNRIGLAVEAHAVENSPVFTGRNRDEIRWTGAKKTKEGYEGDVIAFAAHSLYVELGFTGHFVPFKSADDLYRQALTQWGWKVPDAAHIKELKPGERYLIPRGRKYPQAGVFVSGKAQPFLRPAADFVNEHMRDAITKEELQKAVQESRT